MALNLPVNARSWEPSPDSSRRKAVFFEVLDIPGLNARRAEKDTAIEFQGVVELLGLNGCVATRGVKPVHRIHDLSEG